MIDIAELRIGNLVSISEKALHYDGPCDYQFEIEALHKDVCFLKGFGAGEYYKDLEPFPISEEWLLRAGFTLVDQPEDEDLEAPYYVHEELSVMVGLLNDNTVVYFLRGAIDQNYELIDETEHELLFPKDYKLHQFQNLIFAMRGIELEFPQ